MSSNLKYTDAEYGLFVVKCMNVGDDIQTLAARRFIPRVDHYIDRDRLDLVKNIKTEHDKKLKIIMNGWYLGGYQHWPPENVALAPLMTSIHLNPLEGDGAVIDSFKSSESIEFLKKFSPIGARDKTTLKILKDSGIDSYFSACMTLTLIPDKNVSRKNFILAVNVSDRVYETMKSRTDRPIVRMDVERTQNTTVEENLALARYYLYMYQSAHCVVTTRLHATLPTVAVEGRVLFIVERNGDNGDFNERFSGLYELVNFMTAEEYIADSGVERYDINKPPNNPHHYKKHRAKLEKVCRDYTGYDSGESYMLGETIETIVTSATFFSALTKISEESWDAYKYENRMSVPAIIYDDVHQSEYKKRLIEDLQSQIYLEQNPGVITSLKRLVKSIGYKLRVIKREAL